MDLMDIATQLFLQKIGGEQKTSATSSVVQMALKQLFAGDDGEFDLGDLLSKFQTGDLLEVASSWLGDGDNGGISAKQILDVLGDQNVGDFASKIGIDKETASGGLAETIPELIDKSSQGGNLLDSVGGVGGLADLAKKFF